MALKISEEELLAAVTKTITVITNTSNVWVELDSFSGNESFTFVTCRAVLHERKYGKALELLNASITDKAFTSNMSSILGVSLNMSEANWMYSSDNTTISTLMNNGSYTGGSGGSDAVNNAEDNENAPSNPTPGKLKKKMPLTLKKGKQVN
jgi:Mn-containing catalase